MATTLLREHIGSVTTLWMNRPDMHNAFNAALIEELTQALAQLADDPATRVLVLSGKGKSFSAGADIAWMKAGGEASIAANKADAQRLADMLAALAQFPKPTIARVHGAAIGGGMGLAAACDICIASELASFATPEVRLGLIPAAISPVVLRAIGPRQASRYFLTGERISAARALELGLAHEVVSADQLDDTIAHIAKTLCSGGPMAQTAAKSLIRELAYQPPSEEQLNDTANRIATLRASPEGREGLQAFLEKRVPNWLNETDDVS